MNSILILKTPHGHFESNLRTSFLSRRLTIDGEEELGSGVILGVKPTGQDVHSATGPSHYLVVDHTTELLCFHPSAIAQGVTVRRKKA